MALAIAAAVAATVTVFGWPGPSRGSVVGRPGMPRPSAWLAAAPQSVMSSYSTPPEPAAYCVSGRPPAIVVTTAALGALDDRQLDAVVAHERAHLAGHHPQHRRRPAQPGCGLSRDCR